MKAALDLAKILFFVKPIPDRYEAPVV